MPRDLKREAPLVKFLLTPCITGICEGWVTNFTILPDSFQLIPNCGFIIHNNIHNNHPVYFVHVPNQFWFCCCFHYFATPFIVMQ